MPIAWHAGPQQKGDSLRVETPSAEFFTRAFVPLPVAAFDFVEGFKPTNEDFTADDGLVHLIAYNLMTGASHAFTYAIDPSLE